MPTYEYACTGCGLHFEKQQSMTDAPVSVCPECGGNVERQISGGSGFIMKSGSASRRNAAGSCSLEETGRTCCGAASRCGQSPCGE
ncbi:MAG: zinc ribbon domain-containing protein [Deltaproteobacteria bacterium]|jgi:putative FmdB family regulatory protein|nr:zinc ribbon domain-containing protein [Syntrophaceae bacterium]